MGTTWTVGRKLCTGVGVLVALPLASGGVSYWASSGLHEEFERHATGTAGALDLAFQMKAHAID